MNKIVKNISDLPDLASQLLKNFPQQRIWAFYGDMGVGKTTLIKELCFQLGVTKGSASPTFAMINEYITEQNQLLYHFDFYRIEKIEEAIEIGFEDYLYSGSYCFIEWSEKIDSLLVETFLKIEMTINKEYHRKITITEENKQ